MNYYDDYDNGPTKAECDAEAAQEELDEAVRKDPLGARLTEIVDRLDPVRHRRLFLKLGGQLDDLTSDIAGDLREANTDEYELRGLRRSDF